MGRRKTNFEQSLENNMATYWAYFNQLLQLAITSFEWINVPEGIDQRFLELTLFSDGKAILFRDDDLGEYLGLQFTNAGSLNVYRDPARRRAYAVNGYQKILDESNSVIVWNNNSRTNSYITVLNAARRLYNLDRIIDTNANAQKTPYIIQCTDTQRLTFKNMWMNLDGNEPVIFADKSIDMSGISVLRTDAPYIAEKIYDLKTKYWNEVLTYLGISNVTMQKKERMVTDEVIRNMGGVLANRFCRLQPRQIAAEKFNKMFGTDLQVRFRDGAELQDKDLPDDLRDLMINEVRSDE